MTNTLPEKSIRKHEIRFLRFEKAVFSKVAAVTGATSLAAVASWQALLDKVQAGTASFAADAGVGDMAMLERLYAEANASLASFSEALASGVNVTQSAEALVLNIATIHERLLDVLPEGYQPLVRGDDKVEPTETTRMIMSVVTG